MSSRYFSEKLPDHAIFSPSQPSWLNYSDEQIIERYCNMQATERGTRLHEWAAETIALNIRQSRTKKTLNMFINDAIGFRMIPENDFTHPTRFVYSEFFFGTCDAYSYSNKILRIHDLKTGKGPVHPEQLEIYAALFYLQEKLDPFENQTILRIYQNDDVAEWEPEPDRIKDIMALIVRKDKLLREYLGGLYG